MGATGLVWAGQLFSMGNIIQILFSIIGFSYPSNFNIGTQYLENLEIPSSQILINNLLFQKMTINGRMTPPEERTYWEYVKYISKEFAQKTDIHGIT